MSTEAPARPARRGGRVRKRRGQMVDGWLILDKPPGLTSTESVNRLKRAFDAQKAGHGGTLDPLATGVLPVAFGTATKTVPYVQDGTKLYRFTLRFGEARDTDDADGAVVATSGVRPTDAALVAALPGFVGDILQVPPAYSALKVAGERAYDMAREGRAPDLPPRPARVDRFELIARPDADTAEFEVESGKGVYMRALARDVARACGAVGHVAALRRLRVGPFRIEQAVTLAACARAEDAPPLSATRLLPVGLALADIAAAVITPVEAAMLREGQPVSMLGMGARVPVLPPGSLVRAMLGSTPQALCRLRDGMLQPERLL